MSHCYFLHCYIIKFAGIAVTSLLVWLVVALWHRWIITVFSNLIENRILSLGFLKIIHSTTIYHFVCVSATLSTLSLSFFALWAYCITDNITENVTKVYHYCIVVILCYVFVWKKNPHYSIYIVSGVNTTSSSLPIVLSTQRFSPCCVYPVSFFLSSFSLSTAWDKLIGNVT